MSALPVAAVLDAAACVDAAVDAAFAPATVVFASGCTAEATLVHRGGEPPERLHVYANGGSMCR